MPFLLIRHKVKDYPAWRVAFDAHAPARTAAGQQTARVFRDRGQPEQVVILCQWDSLANARRFAATQDLAQAMQRAGVLDPPDIFFLEEA